MSTSLILQQTANHTVEEVKPFPKNFPQHALYKADEALFNTNSKIFFWRMTAVPNFNAFHRIKRTDAQLSR